MRFKITRTRQIEEITYEPGNAIGRLSGWHDEVSTFVVDGRDALRRELDAEAVPVAQQRQDAGRFGDSRYSVAWEPIETPAQLAVLAVVDEHGASMLAARTWPAKNHVHVSAARALVRRGVLVEQLGPDGVFVSRAKSVSA